MFVTTKNKNGKTGQGVEVPDRTAVRTALSQDKDRAVLGRCVLVDICLERSKQDHLRLID